VALSEEQIKNAVRKRYSELAVLNESCCEQSNCCTPIEKSASIPAEALQVEESMFSKRQNLLVEAGE